MAKAKKKQTSNDDQKWPDEGAVYTFKLKDGRLGACRVAEQATGGRAFVAGTIGDLLAGALQPDRSRVRIFSPFGLGVLDMAVARFVYEQAVADGTATAVDDFFASD